MKLQHLLLFLLLLSPSLTARTLEIRVGGTYTTLAAAAADVRPGDTILFRGGVYNGGEHVAMLQGSPGAWITIMAAASEEVIIRGGNNSWQLSDPAYLHIIGFTLEGQTGNGMNIDDDGSPETPAHHIVIERCTWRGIDATGNNDLLKLSGVDSFEVRDCNFRDGAAGGSLIDMVGCHNGTIVGNQFERAGSSGIQAKGGTHYINIERNRFLDAGARAINIGGSTGLQFFRPLGATYESAHIAVHSNIFIGSEAPIAFVGTVNSEVVNNTIYLPGRWAIRVLQETTEPGFLQCGDNVFQNNIVVVGNDAAARMLNIGPNTRPETFNFSNNLWHNIENPNWGGPTLPVTETHGIVRRDPLISAAPDDMGLRPGSPAIGAGRPVAAPQLDYRGNRFAPDRSIGAIEGNTPTTSVEPVPPIPASLRIIYHPGSQSAIVHLALPHDETIDVALYDINGRRRWNIQEHRTPGYETLAIPLGGLPTGVYLCVVRYGKEMIVQPVGVQR